MSIVLNGSTFVQVLMRHGHACKVESYNPHCHHLQKEQQNNNNRNPKSITHMEQRAATVLGNVHLLHTCALAANRVVERREEVNDLEQRGGGEEKREARRTHLPRHWAHASWMTCKWQGAGRLRGGDRSSNDQCHTVRHQNTELLMDVPPRPTKPQLGSPSQPPLDICSNNNGNVGFGRNQRGEGDVGA